MGPRILGTLLAVSAGGSFSRDACEEQLVARARKLSAGLFARFCLSVSCVDEAQYCHILTTKNESDGEAK